MSIPIDANRDIYYKYKPILTALDKALTNAATELELIAHTKSLDEYRGHTGPRGPSGYEYYYTEQTWLWHIDRTVKHIEEIHERIDWHKTHTAKNYLPDVCNRLLKLDLPEIIYLIQHP